MNSELGLTWWNSESHHSNFHNFELLKKQTHKTLWTTFRILSVHIAELENLFCQRRSRFCSVEIPLILPLFPLQSYLRWNCSIFSSPADVWSPPEAKPNADVLESSLPRSNAIGVVCVKDLYSITSHVLRAIIKSCSSPSYMWKIEQSLPADH